MRVPGFLALLLLVPLTSAATIASTPSTTQVIVPLVGDATKLNLGVGGMDECLRVTPNAAPYVNVNPSCVDPPPLPPIPVVSRLLIHVGVLS